jgi:predicted transcriptional regulator YdeE
MNIERITLPAVTVIGREGSTNDGPGFIQRLWADANAHFAEIEPMVKRNSDGTFAGFWGAMTDFSRAFRPWENNFSEGLYLAGAECESCAEPPEGWSKWIIPAFEYLKVENADFPAVLAYMNENNFPLAGAVHDFTEPSTGRNYMLFPIKRI